MKGTLYVIDVEAEYILVSNISNGAVTYSDQEGYFEIKAQVSDTVSFTSIFYKEKNIVLKKHHFDEKIRVNLSENINKFDEIILRIQNFDVEEYNKLLNIQLAYDIENNLQAYEKPPSGLADGEKILKLINKLVNKKQKKPIKKMEYASFSELNSLFEKPIFLNNMPLKELLTIKDVIIPLFLDFCRERVDKELLKDHNQFLLIDRLITLSLEFDKIN